MSDYQREKQDDRLLRAMGLLAIIMLFISLFFQECDASENVPEKLLVTVTTYRGNGQQIS